MNNVCSPCNDLVFALFQNNSSYFSGLNLIVNSERIYLTLQSEMKISLGIRNINCGIEIGPLKHMLTTSEILQASEGNSESSGVTNAFDINNIDVEDTIVNLTVKKIATRTTTRTPYTPLLVIVRLSREVRKDIEGLRAKIVSCVMDHCTKYLTICFLSKHTLNT